MTSFPPFSTAPSTPGAGGSNLNALVSGAVGNVSVGTVMDGSCGSHRSSPPQQQSPQQLHSQQSLARLGGEGSGVGLAMGSPPHTGAPVMTFSTSAATMPNHNSKLNPSLGAQFGTFHMSASTEVPAARATMNDRALENITEILSALLSIPEWREQQPKWADLLDSTDPQTSAQRVATALASAPAHARAEAITSLARGIVSPEQLAIVDHLEEPYRNEVRDVVLQELLTQLTLVTNSESMPRCAEMLAELARRNLVRVGGVAVAVEQFLTQPERRRAGLAVLGRMAEYHSNHEAFLRAMQATKRVEPLLCELYKEPEFEYDVIAITRMLSAAGPAAAFPPLVQRHGVIAPYGGAPVTGMAYYRPADELCTAHVDGGIHLWGAPDESTGELLPASSLPLDSVMQPTCVASSTLGDWVAVGTAPRAVHPLASPTPGAILIHTRTEDGVWREARRIARGPGVVTTVATGVTSRTLATAESGPMEQSFKEKHFLAGEMSHHNICIYDTETGRVVCDYAFAHERYITALTPCSEEPHLLLSGGYDGSTRLWDTRMRLPGGSFPEYSGVYPSVDAAPMSSSPMAILSGSTGVTDTITTLCSDGRAVFTGCLDGTLNVWDVRQPLKPLDMRRWFPSPVLDVALVGGGRMAVATGCGLYLISLRTMGAVDVVPNVTYSKLQTNGDRNVIFAAGQEGVTVYSLLA